MKYVVYGKDGSILHKGKTKAKKKESSFAAKTKFGAHVEKKYGEKFGRLEITSCEEENSFMNMFDQYKNESNASGIDNLNDLFGGMFGGKK